MGPGSVGTSESVWKELGASTAFQHTWALVQALLILSMRQLVLLKT